eukprot:gene20606-27406_t
MEAAVAYPNGSAEENIVDDDEELLDDDDYDQEYSTLEADHHVGALPSPASSVLQPPVGLGRVFRVFGRLRALMGHRPSILLAGWLEEIVQKPDGSVALERVAVRGLEGKASDEEHGLQISLRYEPPSAKFKASRGVSFRLSVIEQGHPLLSCRGLPLVLNIQAGALAVAWGPLQIVFENGDQMDAFFQVVSKYVEIAPVQLWPPHVVQLWAPHARVSLSAESGSCETVLGVQKADCCGTLNSSAQTAQQAPVLEDPQVVPVACGTSSWKGFMLDGEEPAYAHGGLGI